MQIQWLLGSVQDRNFLVDVEELLYIQPEQQVVDALLLTLDVVLVVELVCMFFVAHPVVRAVCYANTESALQVITPLVVGYGPGEVGFLHLDFCRWLEN